MVSELATGSGAPRGSAAEVATAKPDLDAADDLARFAKLVSHDFSGPLRAIRGFANLLGDTLGERVDEYERNYLTEIVTASERMQGLNDGLVTCLRARAASLEIVEVSLDSVLGECLDAFGNRIADQGALITASPLPVVRADPLAIQLVLHHLLDNAMRHAGSGRTAVIHIAAARRAREWAIVVRDNGPGIPEASREQVFMLFKRLEPSREPNRPGIGLTLCRTLIEKHGGRLWIDTAPGRGTQVTFTLPMPATSAVGVQWPVTAADADVDSVDVAERNELVQSRAALAAIVEFSGDAIISNDLNGLIVTWNRAAETLYGFSADEAIGSHISMLIPPDRRDELQTLMDGVRAGTRLQLETVWMRKGGALIDVSLTISTIRDIRGDLVAASVIARDVTDRRGAGEQIRAFLEVAPDAIVVIDRTGLINVSNAQAEALFGYARDELVGQPLEMLLPERFRGRHAAHRLGFTAAPGRRPMGAGLELYGLRRDGTEFPVDIQLSSLPTKDGALPVASIRDVTSRQHLEQLRDDFITNAAHELRTPLTTLAGLGETLARRFDVMARADIEDAFAAMARQGERARILIANLLDLSDVEGGRTHFTIDDVEVGPLVARVLEAAPPPEGKAVTVAVADGLRVQADPARLEQVLTNLLVNSYRYGGAEIRIDAASTESRVVLSVADDGSGVSPELVTKLFEPFTRGSQASVVRGSGIGLALCRLLVQGMGGEIGYEALVPRGASFRVSLGGPS